MGEQPRQWQAEASGSGAIDGAWAPFDEPLASWSATQSDADGAWVTIAPGVHARADLAEPLPQHRPTAGAAHGDPQGSGGDHRASGGSMAAADSGSGASLGDGEAPDERAGPGRGGRHERPNGRGEPRAAPPRPGGRAPDTQGSRGRLAVALVALAVVGFLLWRGTIAEPTTSTRGSVDQGAASGPVPTLGAPTGETDPGVARAPATSGATRDERDPVGRSPSTPGGRADWWAVLEDLDERRAHVLAHADVRGIASYAAAGSAFAVSEARLVAQLHDDGLRPRGWRTSIIAVEGIDGPRVAQGAELMVLTVVDKRTAFELVDEAGRSVRSVPASGKRRWQLTLTRAMSADTGPAASDTAAGRVDAAERTGRAQVPTTGPSGNAAAPGPDGGVPWDEGLDGGVPWDEGLADARSAVADDELPGSGDEVSGADGTALPQDAASPQPSPSAAPTPTTAASDEDLPWRITAVALVA